METKPKTFKERLQTLIDDAKELVTTTSDQEIQQQGIVLIQPTSVTSIECKTEEEFGERMLKTIRKNGKVNIPLLAYDLDPMELEAQRIECLKDGIELLIPATILPVNALMEERYFKPYLIVFTYDKKMFIHPLDGTAFLV